MSGRKPRFPLTILLVSMRSFMLILLIARAGLFLFVLRLSLLSGLLRCPIINLWQWKCPIWPSIRRLTLIPVGRPGSLIVGLLVRRRRRRLLMRLARILWVVLKSFVSLFGPWVPPQLPLLLFLAQLVIFRFGIRRDIGLRKLRSVPLA